MSKIEVDAITQQSGSTLTVGGGASKTVVADATTVTLGRCGGTVALASGASQTGFGRTGTVDWQTGSIKTSTFTAANGEGYFANTSGGAFNMNLPAGSAGAIVSVADYTRTFQTNNLTIVPNGSDKIGGIASNFVAQTEGQSITLVYVDGTEGWINTAESTGQSGLVPAFITACGGTETTSGDFKIHTFTGPGTFTVTCAGNALGSNSVDYLVVAGGGSGASDNGGGAGAGGFRLSNSTCMPGPQTSPLATPTALPVTAQGYPITVGGGAPPTAHGAPGGSKGSRGSNSVFSTIASTGGGGGTNPAPVAPYAPGGSGGGSRAGAGIGTGNTPPVSPSQGNDGGAPGPQPNNSGGGGGAGAVGSDGAPNAGGPGGIGSFVVSSGFAGCNGTTGPVSGARYFAGGGGGAPDANPGQPPGGSGGTGGGGAGGYRGGPAGGAGSTNTGGGGGGAGNANASGAGGSGIVIIRYKFQ